MNNLINQIAECVEHGKVSINSPYPPQMKGQLGADELTRQAIDEGVTPNIISSIRWKYPDTKIAVGGAPVNNEFAQYIGADGYGKNPQELIAWLDKQQ